jgi:aryl-alcohol dehydrogenase-like predicted oxidoreductase
VGLNSLDGAREWIQVPGIDVIQLPIGILDPDAAEIIPLAEGKGIRVIARGIYGAGLLSPRRSPAELRLVTEKWPVIADVHTLAADLGVSAVQLAAWFVRDKAPRAQWIIGINSQTQLHEAVATFTSPMPGADVLANVQDVIDRYPLLLSSQHPGNGG